MRVIKVNGLRYTLETRGHEFEVMASYDRDGKLQFDPVYGWNELEANTNCCGEALLEDIDDAIYNATPELWQVEAV
jgi:hypothetical protein